MALVDVRGFGLNPDIAGSFIRGQQAGQQQRLFGQQQEQMGRGEQIRQLLGQVGQPQTQQQQMLAAQTADFGPSADPTILSQEQLIQQARQIDPLQAEQQLQIMGLDNASKRAESSRFAAEVQSLPLEVQNQRIIERAQSLQQQGRNPKDTLELLDMPPEQRAQALQGVQLLDLSTKERLGFQQRAEARAGIPAEQEAFENLIKDFTPQEKQAARKIRAGLEARAVGSAAQTIAGAGTAELIGDTKAIISQRQKFGELTGASRAKSIDKGIEKIQKIDKGIQNLDRAIKALDEGASTGALQRFAPSIRSSTVELENVRNLLALDVLNAATFGALSQKELEIVKETALPDKLPPKELRQWLTDRKEAERKLRAYYKEQIDHLDQGGTVASFLRMKERQQPADSETQQGGAIPTGSTTNQRGWVLMEDAQGNRAFVNPDDPTQFEEAR